MHATAFVTLSIIAVFLTTICSLSEARTLCKPCVNELGCNDSPAEICVWGEVQNYCGRTVCAKGPGEICGGTFDFFGICGEGMMCDVSFEDRHTKRCLGCFMSDQGVKCDKYNQNL